MDLKKRKHFSPKKEYNFLTNYFFLRLSFQTRKNLALVKFYNAAIRRFLKTFVFRKFAGKRLSVLQNGLSHGCLPISFPDTILWLLPEIEQKRIPLNDNIVWCKNPRVIKDFSNSGKICYQVSLNILGTTP